MFYSNDFVTDLSISNRYENKSCIYLIKMIFFIKISIDFLKINLRKFAT